MGESDGDKRHRASPIIEEHPNCPIDTPVVVDPLTHHARHMSHTEAHAKEIAAQHKPLSSDTGAKLIAGGLSNMALSLLLNPMDVIKVRLQTQSQLQSAGTSLYSNMKYTGFYQAGSLIYREEGYVRGLMRGVAPSMMRDASYSSLRMGLYDLFKAQLAHEGAGKEDIYLWQKIVAGMCSGALGAVIATPTDLVKIRYQMAPGPNSPTRGVIGTFVDIGRTGGIQSLWKGGGPTVVRASVLTASQMSSYDQTKRFLIHSGHFIDGTSTHVIASIVSGLITTTCVNPADVIKTRIMSDAQKGGTKKQMYRGSVDCLVKTIRNEGWLSLMKGWTPNYMRLGPLFLVSLPLSEFIRTSLGADTL
ncbi:solute carrier family 25, member 27-like [Planoprotostelium fungivorum]|uniref:Solute carrier family 25, member 27-like n=1 Tax=Planoprotostelium fungivorum TaxID=1890364 RepID=A0A2P6NA25_9EUKA|nr:solute carrier family 25, member 27-like [Planoprotostelium fungivorum]